VRISIYVAVAAAVLAFAWMGDALAQPLPVQQFNSIKDLRQNMAAPTFSAHVAAYYCGSGSCPPVTPDGGEGLFVASGSCATNSDDGGYKIVDSYTGGGSGTGTCWYRQNINGDLRQFGATKGSKYDCSGGGISSSAGANGCTSNPADGTVSTPNILNNAEQAAEKAGIHRLTASGIQIYLSGAFSLDGSMTLEGGVGSPDVSNHTIDSPGTIWTTDTLGATALTLGSGSVLRNAAVMPHWIGQNLYDWGVLGDITYLDQQQILSDMVNTGQTGIACNNPNCDVRNAVVAGYDTAVDASGQGTLLEDVVADGNACIYFHDSGAGTHWRNLTCGPKATSDGVSEEYFNVTAVSEDLSGSHRCQLTVSVPSGQPSSWLSDINTNYYAWVSGLDASTAANANGRWKPYSVTIVGSTATVVLKSSLCTASGSTLNGPTATASYTAATQTIQLASGTPATDIANIKVGQTVTGTGIPANTVVRAVSVSTGCTAPASGTCILVGISNAVTSSQTSTSVTFSSLSYSGLTPDCIIATGGGSTGHCLMLTSQERIDAGTSNGGLAAGGVGCATAFLIGSFNVAATPPYACQTGMGATGKTAGFDLLSPFCYAFAVCYHLANAYNTRLISAGMDATRNLNDDDTAFGIVDGSFKGVSIIGGKVGKGGAGLVVNPSGTDKGCVTVSSQNLSGYEVDQGCLLGDGLDAAGILIVSDNALAVQVSGYAPNLRVYKQDATGAHLASAITDTSGALQTKSGATWWGGQFTPGGFPPRVAGTGGSGPTYVNGNDSVGRFTLGSGSSFAPIVTFSHSWANVPVCRASDESSSGALLSATASTAALTITGTLTPGHTIAYICEGYSN
jgi:hypothetical protein